MTFNWSGVAVAVILIVLVMTIVFAVSYQVGGSATTGEECNFYCQIKTMVGG